MPSDPHRGLVHHPEGQQWLSSLWNDLAVLITNLVMSSDIASHHGPPMFWVLVAALVAAPS